jgi:hypothetical protein
MSGAGKKAPGMAAGRALSGLPLLCSRTLDSLRIAFALSPAIDIDELLRRLGKDSGFPTAMRLQGSPIASSLSERQMNEPRSSWRVLPF